MNNDDLFNLVKKGSSLTGALALTVLNQRTSGEIRRVASQIIEHRDVKDTENKHGEALGRNTPRSTSHGEAI